ncbi:unnamed protein product [Rotaria magnacalcarata]|uniref:NAD(P)-binding domain-containing protein n=1 Tax=Rotaria magnacalcarata TaxID=392030 RepID=A0A816XD04_9BILA|nr:unnamed protein product [Rotaria magnacalcarata]CAF1599381.1 unnamed protein product [Rotaria magnacalcarata]CAF2107366.1 unnamed protein product [Rotaria magnacalcarata]CAF2145680.1 unnamed protein product [Rotaria magnacalcarata]CAF4235682.1 unnamed protein product [Rotaria magnacalcarata]
MRILIFGSTGLVGTYVLNELLAHRYHVIAGCVRNSANLDPFHLRDPHLTVVDGDVLISDDVERAFTNNGINDYLDGIITCIGEELDCIKQVYSRGHRNIFDAFKNRHKFSTCNNGIDSI